MLRVNKCQRDSGEGKSPSDFNALPECCSAHLTPELTHIPSSPRPLEESFIRFPSLLGRDLGEQTMPNCGEFREDGLLLSGSNLSLAFAKHCTCFEDHGDTQKIQR